MKELSPRAQALIDAARDADAPESRDRARIQARLAGALGASAFTAAASHAAASAAASGSGAGAASTLVGNASGAAVAAGGATAAASGAGAAAASTVGSAATAAAGSAGGLGAAVASGSASGWVAVLSVKSAAWIGAAALSAAVGTTAVVTTDSHTEPSGREAPAAERGATPFDATTQAARDRAERARVSLLPVGSSDLALGMDPAQVDAREAPAGRPAETAEISTHGSTAADAQPPVEHGAPDRKAAQAPTSQSRAPAAANKPWNAQRAARSGNAIRGRSDDATKARSEVERDHRAIAVAALAAANLAPRASGDPSKLHTDVDAISDARAADSAQLDEDDEVRPTSASDVVTTVAAPAPPTAAARPAVTTAQTARAAPPPAAAVTSRVDAPASAPQLQPSAAKARTVGEKQPGAVQSGELELLALAQRALHAGKLSLALTLLDQHRAQHAQGALREERLAARAVVLCRMHQLGAGLAETERLVAHTPRSPLLPWVRAHCKR